jgi:hypothetical protein
VSFGAVPPETRSTTSPITCHSPPKYS